MSSAVRRGLLGREVRPWGQPAGRRVTVPCVVIVLTALLVAQSAAAFSTHALASPIRVTVGSTAIAHAYDTAIPIDGRSAAAPNVTISSLLGSSPSPRHMYDDRSQLARAFAHPDQVSIGPKHGRAR